MTRELLLLRHGKSDWTTDSDDFLRPLKGRGKRSAERMGAWLHAHALVPDHWISSPAERARATAQRCANTMELDARLIHYDDRIYEAGLSPLLEVLAGAPEQAQRIMLVGHNPGLEDLLIHLTGDQMPIPPDGKLLPTATLARLSMPENWHRLKAGCAGLVAITRPGDLPKFFPFPGPDSFSLRQRPAYYYRQCASLPYRFRKGRLEILLVASRGQSHWVLPKGIQDPGLSPQEAALKEALEEAGTVGSLDATEIGRYRYRKWGADCEVRVFPLRVSDLLHGKHWPERGRKRQWLEPQVAAGLLEHPELGILLEGFTRQLEQNEKAAT